MSGRTQEMLTRYQRLEEREAEFHPLDWRLILRLYEFTRPIAAQRNLLLGLVVIRSLQLPLLTWMIPAVIKGPISRGDLAGLGWSIAGFGVLAAATQGVLHFRIRYALELGEFVVREMRSALFRHLQELPMSFYNRTKLGRIISRMTSDIENVRMGVQDVLFVSLIRLGQMLVAAVCMCLYDPVLFLLVLAAAPVLFFLNRYFHRELSRGHFEVQESFSRVTATLAESVNGMRVTQAFERQDRNAAMFGELVADHSATNYKVGRLQGIFLPLLDLNSEVCLAAILVVGGYRVLLPDAPAEVADLIGFFFMANLFFAPVADLGTQYDQALTAMAGAERFFSILDRPPDWTDPPEAAPVESVAGEVEFDQVTFAYDPGRPVLHDISFRATPGQAIALVGATGSGKTSIVNLVAKFYVPLSGKVSIDGRDLGLIRTDSWRRQLGVVLQTNFLFTGTVLENIRMGRADATEADVIAAARRLDCLSVFEALPDGLQTEVGERGANLSLGQRQLVCFTRALVADPRILILDEATSSVDPITEARIQKALAILIRGRTSFIVAHRLSTIRHADQVLVLDHGRIVERGTHPELVRQGGLYATLYRNFVESGAA